MTMMTKKKDAKVSSLPSMVAVLLFLIISSVSGTTTSDSSSSVTTSHNNNLESSIAKKSSSTQTRRKAIDEPFHIVDVTNTSTAHHHSTSEHCPLKCEHGTVCIRGEGMDFTDLPHPLGHDGMPLLDIHKERSRNGWYCQCTDGLSGIECSHRHKTCNDVKHVCYNGGECIDDNDVELEDHELYCNCQPQFDPNTGTTHYYSGKYCQVEIPAPHDSSSSSSSSNSPETANGAQQTTSCQDNPDFYCKNGGYCKNAQEYYKGVNPCNCPEGFKGKHCEYDTSNIAKCDLPCENGGVCRYGVKDVDPTHGKFEQAHIKYQHCECPSGFTGNFCEVSKSDCGNFICLHGSKCLTNDKGGETSHFCDCSTISKDAAVDENGQPLFYAGRHCEYQSTSICTYDDDPGSTTTTETLEQQFMFCTNDGTCPKEKHHICACHDGRYTGAHCEFLAEEIQHEKEAHAYQCQLQCHNGGSCRKGVKGGGGGDSGEKVYNFNEVEEELAHMNITLSHNGNFEYCSCPKGTVGLTCEYEYVACSESLAKAEAEAEMAEIEAEMHHFGQGGFDGRGDPHHLPPMSGLTPFGHKDYPCFHGATCTMKNGKPYCDCEHASKIPPHHNDDTTTMSKPFAAAGKYCQHTSFHKNSNICHVESTTTSQNVVNTWKGFCANGGVCIENFDISNHSQTVKEHASCDCKKPFTGLHCEINEKEVAAEEAQQSHEESESEELAMEMASQLSRPPKEEDELQSAAAAAAMTRPVMTSAMAAFLVSIVAFTIVVVAVYEIRKRRVLRRHQNDIGNSSLDGTNSISEPPSSYNPGSYNPGGIETNTLGLEEVPVTETSNGGYSDFHDRSSLQTTSAVEMTPVHNKELV